MVALVPGQNVELSRRELVFPLPSGARRVAALVLDEQRHAHGGDDLVHGPGSHQSGIAWRDNGIHFDLDSLSAAAHRVLCIAFSDEGRPGALACSLGDVSFAIAGGDVHRATVCFEVYRRGTGWKVRAVGQGYAGGISELLVAHGLTGSEAGTAPPPPPPPQPVPPPPVPTGVGPTVDPLRQIWMIYEDAARISAAFRSARDFASSRLDDEMSAAVADPSTRNTPAASAAAAAAQGRHDDLVERARSDYDGDATHLINELRELDGDLPPALASWQSASWRRGPASSSGLRIGSISVSKLGPLAVPLCVPAPLQRPLWLEFAESTAAITVVTSLVLRLLAAAWHPAPTLDVIDLAGGLRPFWQPLADRMVRPVVNDPSGIAPRLRELVMAADLADMRAEVEGQPSPASVVVFGDFGFGLQPEAIADVAALAGKSGLGTSLILVGEDNWDGVSPLMRELSEFSQHVGADGQVYDPWTGNAWAFRPDVAPEPGRSLADLLGGMAALQPSKADPR